MLALTLVGGGDVGASAAVSAELPAVEGALDAVAHYTAADSEVSAEVWAVRVHDVRAAIRPPEHRQIQT